MDFGNEIPLVIGGVVLVGVPRGGGHEELVGRAKKLVPRQRGNGSVHLVSEHGITGAAFYLAVLEHYINAIGELILGDNPSMEVFEYSGYGC